MWNIEYLRQLHLTKLNLKRTQFCVKEFFPVVLFLRKGPCFSVLRKGLDLHILRHEKSLDFGRFLILFDLILYVPSTIFQLNRDVSSWVEPVLS